MTPDEETKDVEPGAETVTPGDVAGATAPTEEVPAEETPVE